MTLTRKPLLWALVIATVFAGCSDESEKSTTSKTHVAADLEEILYLADDARFATNDGTSQSITSGSDTAKLLQKVAKCGSTEMDGIARPSPPFTMLPSTSRVLMPTP